LSKPRRRISEAGQYVAVEAPASARVEVQEVMRLGAQGGNKLGSDLQWRAAEHGVLAREGTDGFYVRA
jgi:hypothetical protein